MKLRPILILSFILFVACVSVAFAQTRGVGVGALVTRTGGTTQISITSGKTAPWAEVVVENSSDIPQAIAELDGTGDFNFTFLTDPVNIGNLYITATDSAAVVQKVSITGTTLNNELLPPTLISKDANSLPANAVKFFGYTYPKSAITITVIADNGYNNTVNTTSNTTTGEWTISLKDLMPGTYKVTAVSSFSGIKSKNSTELDFIVQGAIGAVIESISPEITKAIVNLPAPVKVTASVVSKVASPVLTGWIILQTIFTGLNLQDLLLVFLTSIIGRRKKRKWGIVYDTITKTPLASAIVRLYKEDSALVETDVTGKLGVFSFLAPPGKYKITVAKANYTFPSKNIKGEHDQEYQSLYYGDTFEVKEGENINFDIPIDPRQYILPFKRAISLKKLFNEFSEKYMPIITPVGVILSFVAAITRPTLFNDLILVFYILTVIVIFITRVKRSVDWGVVSDEKGRGLPLISLSLIEPLFDRQVQRRITDEGGRYHFLVPSGRYYIKVTMPGFQFVKKRNSYIGEVIEIKKESDVIKPRIILAKKA